MRRRTLNIKNLVFITFVSSFFVAFILPNIVTYILSPKDNISIAFKEDLAVAGENYFNQEPSKNIVYLDELMRKGYIEDKLYLGKNDCILQASTVSIERFNNKHQYIVDLYCQSYFSKLTMSN